MAHSIGLAWMNETPDVGNVGPAVKVSSTFLNNLFVDCIQDIATTLKILEVEYLERV